MAGIMIATSVWMPVYADVAVTIPAEGKYTTETEYTTELTEYKKLPVATDTEADRDDEIPTMRSRTTRFQTRRSKTTRSQAMRSCRRQLAHRTEAIPVEEVLPVATPTTLMMVPVMLASQTMDLSQATTVITIDQNGEYTFTGTWPRYR